MTTVIPELAVALPAAEPMSEAPAQWQEPGRQVLEMFPYEEDDGGRPAVPGRRGERAPASE